MSINCESSNAQHDVEWYSEQYYKLIMNSFYKTLLNSVTEDEFNFVKDKIADDDDETKNMTYETFAEQVDKEDLSEDKQLTLSHITEFLKKYVIFQDELYVMVTTEFMKQVKDNTNSLKKDLMANMEMINKYTESQTNEGEEEIFTEQENDLIISAQNEGVGVFNVRIGGSTIEVDTHNDDILCVLVPVLFRIYCEISQFKMVHVLSDRVKK